MAASQLPCLSLVVAVAIVRSLAQVGIEDVTLKWPNDVLVNNRKVAGILVDSVFIGSDIEYAVIGIGINANTTLADLPESLHDTATTLRETLNRVVDVSRLFEYLVGQLEFWYLRLRDKGFKAIEPHYRGLCTTLDKRVTIDLGDD